MPKAEIEILRTVTVARDESVMVEADVPQNVLDDPDELFDWVEAELNKEFSPLRTAADEYDP